MSGDLISRSALIKDADKHFGHPNAFYSNESFKELIGNQPTAYNVDKVVEQLADEILCDGCSGYTNCFELDKRRECNSYKAIESIVKAGGVE